MNQPKKLVKLIRSIPKLRQWVVRTQQSGCQIALVPTMGALHQGHLSLIHRARREAGKKGRVIVSIFVNPTQFNQKSDFLHYPKPLAADMAICRAANVDLVFAPTVRNMYPTDFSTWVEEKKLSLPLCGAKRPGHFRGVCTIVLKLFHLVQPDIAIFGQKDAQQVAVIQRMIRDLNIPVRMIIAPVVREKDGLAMSSRNQRLTPIERPRAIALYETLRLVRSSYQRGIKNSRQLKNLARQHLIKTPGLKIDYLEFVNGLTLKSVTTVSRGDLFAIAVFIGKIRLIDHIRL